MRPLELITATDAYCYSEDLIYIQTRWTHCVLRFLSVLSKRIDAHMIGGGGVGGKQPLAEPDPTGSLKGLLCAQHSSKGKVKNTVTEPLCGSIMCSAFKRLSNNNINALLNILDYYPAALHKD